MGNPGTLFNSIADATFRWLPQGGSLPEKTWLKRHHAMKVLLWLHVPALFVMGVVTDHGVFHVLAECGILVLAAIVGGHPRVSRTGQTVATSLGLLTASAIIVHFSGGLIEMHFHFFVIVAAVTLYQQWLPFLIAIGYVVLQHGIAGILDPSSVYNHPAAVQNPWKWALIHGTFIMGESITLLIAWRLNEESRAAAESAYQKRLMEEKARREAQEQFGRIFENSLEGIYETTPGGRFLTANPALARLLGFESAEELRDNGTVDIYYADRKDREIFIRTLEEQDQVSGFEFAVKRKDGKLVWLSDNARAVRDTDGRLIAIQGMVQDITERKTGELKRHELETQLRQAQKMDAVGQLAGGVAHDFNNLLSIIQNYAHFSIDGLEADDPRAQDMKEVLNAARRGTDLVRQLLAFSRKDGVSGMALDINEVVQELGKMLIRTLGEHVMLKLVLAPELSYVETDTGHVEQILMNLALNARDAMPDGGIVTIETSNVHVVRGDGDEVVSPGDYVKLSVRDTGVGIAPNVRERIFEPFFTTKEVGSGTGLGLATVYGIVEHWNGVITVDSEPGRGTSFDIYLPAAANPFIELDENKAIKLATASPSNGHAAKRGATIMVVEDEDKVLEVVRRILTAEGHKVLAASSAAEALEVIDSHTESIDLLLTDMVMPKMSGRELAKQLAEQMPELRVIFMSGYSDEVLSHHGAVDAGTLLTKPFSPQALLEHVSKALAATEVSAP